MLFTSGRGWISGLLSFQRLRWREARKTQGVSRMAAGKSSIHRQVLRFSRFCGPPPISASPTEIWALIFCYQVLLIKCTIYIKPRVDLRGPYFNGSDGQKQARRFCGNEQAIFASTHDRILWFERIGLDHGVASTRARRFCRNKPLRQQNWLWSIVGERKQSS